MSKIKIGISMIYWLELTRRLSRMPSMLELGFGRRQLKK
jgi:hypothetical protein